MAVTPYAEVARLLVLGDGTPRDRDMLVRQLSAALQNAHDAGKREAWPEARKAALREARSALEGAIGSLNAAWRVVDKEAT